MYATATVLALVAFVVGPLIRLALSRRREELADVSGVNLTRNPAGLMHALQKLEANDKPFANFNHATAAMCIDDPLQHHESWFHHLFDTHPPLEDASRSSRRSRSASRRSRADASPRPPGSQPPPAGRPAATVRVRGGTVSGGPVSER